MIRLVLSLVVTSAVVSVGLAQQAPLSDSAIPPLLRSYKPVTAERLLKPEPENWLMIRGTYDGWGFSPLKEITTENVARLKPVWMTATGEMPTHQDAPIVTPISELDADLFPDRHPVGVSA